MAEEQMKNEATVAESEATEKAEKGKKKRFTKKVGRFYQWQVVTAVLVVVVAIGGIGFWNFHNTPEFCDFLCHNPQDPYNPTYYSEPGQPATDKWGNQVADASGMLSATHRAYADANCLSCHEPTLQEQMTEGIEWVTGNFYNPLSERSLDNLQRWHNVEGTTFCLNESCHNMAKSDLTDATANLERNPHSWHHSEYTCSDCHKSHRASVMVCTQCHDDAQVPTGWLSYDESTQLQNQYISYDLEGQVYAD